jgi:hypothetical protein
MATAHPRPPTPGLRPPIALAVALFVVAAFVVKAPQLLAPMGQDQGLYHTVAELILHGGVPYRDAWDPKPPGVFYVHAVLLAPLSDPWRACPVGALQPRCGALLFGLVDFAFSLGLGGLVWLVARRLAFSPAAAVLAFGCSITFVNLTLLDSEGSTPEKYALAPAVGVVLAGLTAIQTGHRRWLVTVGVLGAVAALFKLPDLASLGAVSVVLVARRGFSNLVWVAVPLLAVLAGVWLAFAALGAGPAFLDATLSYNLVRFAFQSERIPFAAVASAWQVFRDGLAVLWLTALIGAGLALKERRWRLLLVWAAFDVVALFSGGTKFTREYFLQLAPSFALLAGLALHSIWSSQSRGVVGRVWLVASLVAIGMLSSAFQAGFTLRVWNEYVARGWTINSVERLASMISNLPAGEALFVWGDEAQLYALSGRLPTTRFLNTAGLAQTGDPTANARRAEMLDRLQQAPPAVIVIDRRTAQDDPDGRLRLNLRYFPELTQMLADDYREMDPAVLRAYVAGDREQVFVRRADATDLCARMPGCRLLLAST